METRFATKAVIFREGKVLLIKKSADEDVNPNSVDIPGGCLEYGETPEEALKREIKEETGLSVNIIKPTRYWSFVNEEKKFQLVGVTFCCTYLKGKEALSNEHASFVWLTPKEIQEGDFPEWVKAEVKAAVKAYKAPG